MKRILYCCSTLLCLSMLAGMVGCSTDGSNGPSEKEFKDSIKHLNTEVFRLQNDLSELVTVLNGTESELDNINGQIAVRRNDDTLLGKRERLQQQLETVRQLIAQKSKELAEYRKKYEQVFGENQELNKCIVRLQSEIEGYQARITALEAINGFQTEEISNLNEELDLIQDELSASNLKAEMQSSIIDNQDKMINEGYYIVGSKSDLKEKGLIEGGLFNKKRLTTKGFDTSVFTVVDIREIEEIPLNSKDARILSPAPEESYELVKGYDNKLILRIVDPTSFWSLSKYLVVMI